MKTVLDYVVSKMNEICTTEAEWATWLAYQDVANFVAKQMEKETCRCCGVKHMVLKNGLCGACYSQGDL